MSTISLSLPNEQITFIDKLGKNYGFTNRSELVRSVLRLLSRQPNILEMASSYPFVTPKEKSVKKIVSDFTKTKKYSKTFLNDLEEGLKSSSYFTDA